MEVYRLGPKPALPKTQLKKQFLVTVCYSFKGQHPTIETATHYAPSEDAVVRGFEYSLPLGAEADWWIIAEVPYV